VCRLLNPFLDNAVLPALRLNRRLGVRLPKWDSWRFAMPGVALTLWLMLAGCSITPPSNITPVTPFDLSRYLGQWHEIARLDHSFERNLIKVTASYSMNTDGSVKVINRGFNTKKQAWNEAIGKAWLIDGPDRGALKVSFFGPFYGGYFVTALDPGYQWAMIVGPDLDYFWILARQPELDATVKARLLDQARTMGVAVDDIIWVAQ